MLNGPSGGKTLGFCKHIGLGYQENEAYLYYLPSFNRWCSVIHLFRLTCLTTRLPGSGRRGGELIKVTVLMQSISFIINIYVLSVVIFIWCTEKQIITIKWGYITVHSLQKKLDRKVHRTSTCNHGGLTGILDPSTDRKGHRTSWRHLDSISFGCKAVTSFISPTNS